MTESHVPKKICVVGSGNWGSVIAKIVGLNVLGLSAEYVETVLMYVHEEIIDGAKLTDIINMKHENVKYLPGVKLPNNVRAHANPVEVCQDADVMIFVIPHQFLIPLCKQLAGKVKPTAVGVSLIKGLSESAGGKLDLISNTIRRALDIQCAVLMGANLAGEVASEFFCEATIGCRNALTGQMLKKLFQTPYFRIVVVRDEEAVEICGALKNVVAMGAGFVSGLGHGENTKAAVVRLGLMEIIEFCRRFFPGCKIETFLQSCGVADLVATCYGGRNRKVAEVFASINGAKTIQELEKEMLNGQKLQGPPTALEVHRALILKSEEDRFPLFTMVHTVSTGQAKPDEFMQCLIDHPEHCH